jgi:hypothetical protein
LCGLVLGCARLARTRFAASLDIHPLQRWPWQALAIPDEPFAGCEIDGAPYLKCAGSERVNGKPDGSGKKRAARALGRQYETGRAAPFQHPERKT